MAIPSDKSLTSSHATTHKGEILPPPYHHHLMAHNSKHALNDDISGIELYNYEDNCICNKMRGDNPICLVHHFNAVTNAVTMCNVNADGDNNKS